MVKLIYDYNEKHIEEECETYLEANIFRDKLKENSNISNVQITESNHE